MRPDAKAPRSIRGASSFTVKGAHLSWAHGFRQGSNGEDGMFLVPLPTFQLVSGQGSKVYCGGTYNDFVDVDGFWLADCKRDGFSQFFCRDSRFVYLSDLLCYGSICHASR